jgi:hypothetical protein
VFEFSHELYRVQFITCSGYNSPMPVTSITSSASLTPSQSTRGAPGPKPNKTVTAAPFSPAAQKQANAINSGRSPHRGGKVNITV